MTRIEVRVIPESRGDLDISTLPHDLSEISPSIKNDIFSIAMITTTLTNGSK
jgi:hypothetical protein